jgi:tripartite-type tricarboxylate transporter receptor subunit TctC
MRNAHRTRLLLFFLGLLSLATSAAFAQAYPSKPIRFVIPFAPGGSTDIIGRVIAEKLSLGLGQPVVVENRPGAGGSVGSDTVAKAAPDGYTILMVPGAHTINASLYQKLPYDTLRDFEPVIQIASVATMIVVHPSVPVKSVGELIELAKARRGELNYGSAGSGTVTHMTAELFKLMAGVDITHVPYKGSSQALKDLLGGQVQVMFANFPGTLQQVQAGRLRVIAVNGARRSPLLPGTPTVAESGIPGFEANTWYGILAPAGTPKAVVARLNSEVTKALDAPEVRDFLSKEGGEVVGGTSEEFAAFIRADIVKWARVIKQAGVRAD